MHNYFIVYNGYDKDEGSAVGNCCLPIDGPMDVKSIGDLEEHIAEHMSFDTVLITNYILMGTSDKIYDNN